MENLNASKAPLRRLRLGIIGGGEGSVIGRTHRAAALIDGRYDIVAGAFDIDPERGQRFARSLFVPEDRIYPDHRALIDGEAARNDGVDLVAVLTPNTTHYEIARDLVNAGQNVLCEKPLTTATKEAIELVRLSEERDLIFAVNYGYSGYPMVRHAKAMVAAGELGKIRVVQTEFAFGNPTTMTEDTTGHWRTKSTGAGPSAVVGMTGTHAIHLASFIIGSELAELSSDFTTFVPGRELEDNANINLRFEDGARGSLWASYVAAGANHGLRIRIHGEKAGLEWNQENPNDLAVMYPGGDKRILTRGNSQLHPAAKRATRIVTGQPEGFLEAVANIYTDVADVIDSRIQGFAPDPLALAYPNIRDGARGVRFVDAAVESAQRNGAWTSAGLDFPAS
jgi:predicted dehydrogenase